VTTLFSNSLIDALATADSVAVLTGAGVSAESGVPTFRDADGLWARFDPYTLASPAGFRADPLLVQRWYAERITAVTTARPNPGHSALAELQTHLGRMTVITQNVDGLHQRAGSQGVIELHGNIFDALCVDCGATSIRGLADSELPLRCEECSGFVRPFVVWFGEVLPDGLLRKAEKAARQSDVFLSIGTSAQVYPAASIIPIAAAAGALTVEINVERTSIAHTVDEVLVGQAGEILPRMLELVLKRRDSTLTAQT
jgi:NAD-dependent deacetylase